MSDFHKEMLDRMYREIPAPEKASFIIDMLAELPAEQRAKVEQFLQQKQTQVNSSGTAAQKQAPQVASREPVPSIAQPLPADVEALLKRGQEASTLTPKRSKTTPQKNQHGGPFLQPSNVKNEMRKELVLFILFSALVLAAIVGLAVGAKHLWDALLAFLGI